jgi:alkylglycerol monooxygenase
MNTLYQFWLHTELVPSLGILELVLNTPSHHRVHHATNAYCADKNYAGLLIIWDRVFGTFQRERKEEKLAYGLLQPVETCNPIYVQVNVYDATDVAQYRL